MNRKGFTLIELAIVLVIIGIILGAIIKGQDLIQNARAKQFTSWVKEWEITMWNYYDRKGVFPNELDDVDNANFLKPPKKSKNFGGSTLYVYIGTDDDPNAPVIVVCASSDCSTSKFTQKQIILVESFDTNIDEEADAGSGNVRAASDVTLGNGDDTTTKNDSVTAVTEETASGTAWAANTYPAMVYYFNNY